MSLCDEVKTVVVYGFEFVFNMDNLCNMRDAITELYAINPMIKAPFRVCGVLSSFDPMMCYSESRDMMTNVVLGFTPNADLTVTAGLLADLKEYVGDALFEKYVLRSDPAFFCGVEWDADADEDAEEESEIENDLEEFELGSESETETESESESESESENEFNFDEIPLVKQEELD